MRPIFFMGNKNKQKHMLNIDLKFKEHDDFCQSQVVFSCERLHSFVTGYSVIVNLGAD